MPPVVQVWEWTATADVLWARPTINWHDDEMSMKGKATLGRFGITVESSRHLCLRYSLTTGFGTADTITPQAALYVGSTNFGKDPTQTGQQQGQDKPVQVEWSMSPTSRIELCGPSLRGLRPVVVSEWSSLTMTGTKNDNGKPKRESESLRGNHYGFGAEITYEMDRLRTRSIVVGSREYLFADTGLSYRFDSLLSIRASWQWKTSKYDRTTVRVNGGYAGVEIPVRLP
jgi:hypothetical protein